MDLTTVPGMVNTTLRTVINYFQDINNYQATKSLADVTKLTRVEPLCVLSRDVVNLEFMPDVMQSLLSIFSGYYLQAISVLTQINDIEVVRILDKLNPDRDSTGWLMSEHVSRESLQNFGFEFSLPTRVSMEANNDPYESETIGDRQIVEIAQMANLSVGKLINVKINYNKSTNVTTPEDHEDKYVKDKDVSTVTIPVTIRLMANVINNETALMLLAAKRIDHGLTERYHALRAGQISFIRDLILCQDLIDEHKKALMGDESGVAAEIIRRVNNSKKFGLLTKNPSLVSASNIFVMSEEMAKQLEVKVGGKLSNKRVRDKVFEGTYAMLLVVIDREWERIKIYTRGIESSTNLSIKDIKNMSKGKGPDIGEILKSYNLGVAPTF